MTLEILLDLLLMAAVVVTAFRAIHAREIFAGVILYIVFGLLLALVWVRLEAPDLAIAEAAIGAGITGAMLLDAARQIGDGPPPTGATRRWERYVAAAASLAFMAVLAVTFVTVEERTAELPARLANSLGESGVEHPVTAVLLNYRAYDTLLEVAVLLAAAAAVLSLGELRVSGRVAGGAPPQVAAGATALLTPLGVLVAAYLLLQGSHAPGGAFPAGAVLGALGVLLTLTDNSPLDRLRPAALRAALAAGFGVFIVVGLVAMAAGGSFLSYRGSSAGLAVLLIETFVAISIGATLALLFSVGRTGGGDERRAP
ncbi:MAG: hydrogenase subunit MbhD domain-containing protein [Gemmatimonadota bacterium]